MSEHNPLGAVLSATRRYRCEACLDTGLVFLEGAPAVLTGANFEEWFAPCVCPAGDEQRASCEAWERLKSAPESCEKCHGSGRFLWLEKERFCGCPMGESLVEKEHGNHQNSALI